jgi:hypothetical protein
MRTYITDGVGYVIPGQPIRGKGWRGMSGLVRTISPFFIPYACFTENNPHLVSCHMFNICVLRIRPRVFAIMKIHAHTYEKIRWEMYSKAGVVQVRKGAGLCNEGMAYKVYQLVNINIRSSQNKLSSQVKSSQVKSTQDHKQRISRNVDAQNQIM